MVWYKCNNCSGAPIMMDQDASSSQPSCFLIHHHIETQMRENKNKREGGYHAQNSGWRPLLSSRITCCQPRNHDNISNHMTCFFCALLSTQNIYNINVYRYIYIAVLIHHTRFLDTTYLKHYVYNNFSITTTSMKVATS